MMSKTKKSTSNSYYRSNRVCRIPDWAFYLKGRLDSRKDVGVCNAYLLSLAERQAIVEADATEYAENMLTDIRKSGARAIVKLSDLKTIPTDNTPDICKGTSPESIRLVRKQKSKLQANKDSVKAILEELAQVHETITYADLLLEQKIQKIRNSSAQKSHAYISGVRSGSLTDYKAPVADYATNALEIYYSKHRELDTRIHTIVSNSMEEALRNEVV